MHTASVLCIAAWFSWECPRTAAQLSPRNAVLSRLPRGSALVNSSWQAGFFGGRPQRAASPIYISIEENDEGPFPKLLDTLPAGGDELFFALTGPGADRPPEGIFIVDEFVPELSITAALDREEHSEFKLTCSQTEGSGAELEPIVVIIKVVDQNDNSPVFAQATFSTEVSEAAPMGTSVWKVVASDKDDPDTPNAQIAYKIISETSAFSIEAQTGVITVSESGLDREDRRVERGGTLDTAVPKEQLLGAILNIRRARVQVAPLHSLEVEAADLNGVSGGHSTTATIAITVTDANDHPPRFTSSQESATVETNEVGAEVLRLSVEDGDEEGTATWNAVYRIASGDPRGHFAIRTDAASNRAIVTVAKAFAEDGTYELTVVAENEAELVVARSDEQTCTVTITVSVGLQPAGPQPAGPQPAGPQPAGPQQKVMHISIEENDDGPFPKSIITVPGEEHELFFSLTGAGADAPPEGLFVVEEFTGEISVTASIDREEHAAFQIVCSRFQGDDSLWGEAVTVIITVIDKNDNSPEFSETTFKVRLSEAATAGTAVLTVSASDKDDPETPNAQIRYKLLSETAAFALEENSGQITVSQAAALDREETTEYTLEVEARDYNGASNGLFAQATVHITVTDVNDNAPTFTQEQIQVTVNKGSKDITIATIAVEDRDEKFTENWRAVYKISGDTEQIFSISTDPNTNEGVLRLDKDIYTDTELKVSVQNEVPLVAGMEETRTAGNTLRVLVSTPAEAGIIRFVPRVTMVRLQDSVLAGQILTVLSARHADSNSNNESIRYAIYKDEANLLDIDEATGKLSARADLKKVSSFFQNNVYKTLVTATLEGEETATATGTVMITVGDSHRSPVALQRTACVSNDTATVAIDVDPTADAQGTIVGSPPFEFFVESQEQGWAIAQMDGSRAQLSVESGSLPCGEYTVPVTGVDALGAELGLSVRVTVCGCDEGPAILGALPVLEGNPGHCLSSGGLAAILCSVIAAPLLGVVFLTLLHKWFTRTKVENAGFIQAACSDDAQCQSQGQGRLDSVVEEMNVERQTSTRVTASEGTSTLLMEKAMKTKHSETATTSKGDQKTLTCVHEDSLDKSYTKARKGRIAKEELLIKATAALISDVNAGKTNINVARQSYRDETEGQEDSSTDVKVWATHSVELLSEQDMLRYNQTLVGKDKVSGDFGSSQASFEQLQLQGKSIQVADERSVEVTWDSESGRDRSKRQDLECDGQSERMSTSMVTSNQRSEKVKHVEKIEMRQFDSGAAVSSADSDTGLRSVTQQAYRQGVNVSPGASVSSRHATRSNTSESGTGTGSPLAGSSFATSGQNGGAKTQTQASFSLVKSTDHAVSVDLASRSAASDTVSTNDSVSSLSHGHPGNTHMSTGVYSAHQSKDASASFTSSVKSERTEITSSSRSRDLSGSGLRQGTCTLEGSNVTVCGSSALQGSGVQDRSSVSQETKTMIEGRSVTPAGGAVKHTPDYPTVVTSGGCEGASGATFSKASSTTVPSFSSSQPSNSSTTTQTQHLSPSQFREEPRPFMFQSSEVIKESQAVDAVEFGAKQATFTSENRRVQFDNASQEDRSLSGSTQFTVDGSRTDVSSLAGGTKVVATQKGMQYSTVVGNRAKATSIGSVPERSATTVSSPDSKHQSSTMQKEQSTISVAKSVQHSIGGVQEGNVDMAGTGLIKGSSSSFSAGKTTSMKPTILSSQTIHKRQDSTSEAKVLHSKLHQSEDSSSGAHGRTSQSLEGTGTEFKHRVLQRAGSQEQQSVSGAMKSTVEGKQTDAKHSVNSAAKVAFNKQMSITRDVDFGVEPAARVDSIKNSSGYAASSSPIQQSKLERALPSAVATSVEYTFIDTSEVQSPTPERWPKKSSSSSSFSFDERSSNRMQGQTGSPVPAMHVKQSDVTERFSTQPSGLRPGFLQLKRSDEITDKHEKENQSGRLVTQHTYFSSIQQSPQTEMKKASTTFTEAGRATMLSESSQLNRVLKQTGTNQTSVFKSSSSIAGSGAQYASKMPDSFSKRGAEASVITELHGLSLGTILASEQGTWEASQRGAPPAVPLTGSKGHETVAEEIGHKQLTSPTTSVGQSHYFSKSSPARTVSSDVDSVGSSTSYRISASGNTVEGHIKHAMPLSQLATKYPLQPLHEAVAPAMSADVSGSSEQRSLAHQLTAGGTPAGRERLEIAGRSQAQLGSVMSTRMTSAPHAMQLQHSMASVQTQAGQMSQSMQQQGNITHETIRSQRAIQSDQREKQVSSRTSIHPKTSISGLKQTRVGDEMIRLVRDESNVTPEDNAGYFRSTRGYESGHTSLGTGFHEMKVRGSSSKTLEGQHQHLSPLSKKTKK